MRREAAGLQKASLEAGVNSDPDFRLLGTSRPQVLAAFKRPPDALDRVADGCSSGHLQPQIPCDRVDCCRIQWHASRVYGRDDFLGSLDLGRQLGLGDKQPFQPFQ